MKAENREEERQHLGCRDRCECHSPATFEPLVNVVLVSHVVVSDPRARPDQVSRDVSISSLSDTYGPRTLLK